MRKTHELYWSSEGKMGLTSLDCTFVLVNMDNTYIDEVGETKWREVEYFIHPSS